MSAATPIQNLEAEESVLGAMLVAPGTIDVISIEVGLSAGDFYRDRHRMVFEATKSLRDHGEPVDLVTVTEELERRGELAKVGGKDAVASLAARVPAPGSATHYARIVVEAADLRRLDAAGKQIVAAVAEREGDASELLSKARALLDQSTPSGDPYMTPAQLNDFAFQVASEGKGGTLYPWPFDRLNQLSGGIRTGQLVLVAGWTHHGKSAFAGQLLESVTKGKDGARACLYFNEMDAEEHIGGWLQRRYGVPSLKFVQGKLDSDERRRMMQGLNEGLPFGMTPVAGWDAYKIASHIRLHRWDVAVVDILHNIRYEDERDLSNAVTAFVEAAKLAECAVVLVAHLNRGRLQGPTRPRPSLRDLRGTGDLENKADIVCFVHREEDEETHYPGPEGEIFLPKSRGGRLGGLEVTFDERRIRFLPVDKRWGKAPPQLERSA